MSWIDDNYDEIVIAEYNFKNSIQLYTRIRTNHQVVWSAIRSFKQNPPDPSDALEMLARDILYTVKRKRRISVKQKQVLVQCLVVRNEPAFEEINDYNAFLRYE